MRPDDVDEDDEDWSVPLEDWRGAVRRLTGNRVEIFEVGVVEAALLARGDGPLGADLRRDGRVVHGVGLDELRGSRSA